jgi:hypothetical protein
MTANRYRPPEYAGRASVPRHGPASIPDRRPQHGTGEWRTIRERSAPRRPPGARTRRPDASPWHWLLFIPIVVPLMPGLYNRIEPTLLGLPFFYWSQLSFAFLASAVITLVHRKTRPAGAVDG